MIVIINESIYGNEQIYKTLYESFYFCRLLCIDLQEPCVIFFFLALYLLVISSNCFVPLLFPHQVMKN